MTLSPARLLPDGLGARFALLLAATLIAANLVALFILSLDRERLDREARERRVIERVAALVPALEAVAPELRAAIATAASTWVARVEIGAEPRVDRAPPDARSRPLAGRLAERLAPREARAAVTDRDAHPDEDDGGPQGDGPRRGERIAVSVALSSPDATEAWVNVSARGNDRAVYDHVQTEALVVILGLSLSAVLGIGLLFVRRLTRPLASLAEAARAAGRGDRSARVPERGARELREAAGAFNAMQERIARFDAERARTVAAVGHDLRTPITSLRIRAEMLEEAAREPMVRTLGEMAVMADGLVAFSRGQEDVERTAPVPLAALLRRLGEERGARVRAPEEIVTRGRPVALSRAIGNLIDNAIRYGGEAVVTLSRQGAHAAIAVEDRGPGIAEDRLPDVFEPFVRGETSRNVDTGGAGLGLSIARTILVAHGGSIVLDNREPPGGLRASVLLPLAERAPADPPTPA